MIAKLKTYLLLKIFKSIYKPGHYYSPIPDITEVLEQQNIIFENRKTLPEIELNTTNQISLLRSFIKTANEFKFPKNKGSEYLYYSNNSFFNESDAFYLYSMIRKYNPKRIIEIGSGFSSALMLDVNREFFNNNIHTTFIEPYPERLYTLISGDEKNVNIINKKVQAVPLSLYEELNENDFLYIDSSHVSKVGSDLNHLLFKVLPLLNKGVIIHFHDITWPMEYPKEWIEEGRFWNEIYLLRAFLMHNSEYSIMLFNSYLGREHLELLQKNLPINSFHGGSIYLKKETT